MMYTDDPVRDYDRYDREQQKWLDRLPKCDHCHEPIQDYNYYKIEEANICEECLTEYCEEHYQVSNTDL